jgi:hypothetical protein
MLFVGLVLLPARGSASGSCTDKWTGGAGDGLWQTAGNWSTSTVPNSTDVVCIGSGAMVQVSASVNHAGVLQSEGVLMISGGSLELASTSEASSAASLTLSGGTLSGAASLEVAGSLSWTGGSMTGSGKTVLEAGATGSIEPGSGNAVALTERDLVNHGTLTAANGSVEGRDSAELDNSGTFIDNAQVSAGEWTSHGLLKSDGSNVWLHNTGTVKKTSGSSYAQIQFQIDNEGTVEAKTGQIIMSGGNTGAAAAGAGGGGAGAGTGPGGPGGAAASSGSGGGCE